MNHDEAIRLKAAEKYLLGELNAELRDQYEDHYFGCAECAQDVRTGAVFIDNARDVLARIEADLLGHDARHRRSGGDLSPQRLMHRTRAPQKTVMLMVETAEIDPIGD